ncbi:MAG TPA: hypothetical protein PKK50_02195 [Myxococcota bacterium]|nr:hypothetical protein [Myxococcota bacterium]
MSNPPVAKRAGARAIAILAVAIPIVFVSGCCGRQSDPVDMIPSDADAWLVTRPPLEMASTLTPLLRKMPGLAGVFELVESTTGMNLADPESSEWIDPRRGLMVSSWRSGWLIVAPIRKAGVAGRRLPLQLARFGFVQGREADGVRYFSSASRGPACMLVKSGVAMLYAGPDVSCAVLSSLVNPPPDGGTDPRPDPVGAVLSELDMAGADVVFSVSNSLFGNQVMKAVGLPTRGAAAMIARGLIGDLRGAARLGDDIVLRVSAGAAGVGFKQSPAVSHAGAPLSVEVTVGPSVRPLLDAAVPLAGKRVRGLDALLSLWSGTMRLVADSAATSDQQTVSTGRTFATRLLTRFDVRLSAGLKTQPGKALELISKRFGVVPPAEGAPSMIDFSYRGFTVHAATSDERLDAVVTGAPSGSSASIGAAPGLPPAPSGSRVISAAVDPELVLKTSGLASIDYLVHLVDPIRLFLADVYYEAGRVVVDARVEVR